jgi:hypothetical protein
MASLLPAALLVDSMPHTRMRSSSRNVLVRRSTTKHMGSWSQKQQEQQRHSQIPKKLKIFLFEVNNKIVLCESEAPSTRR